MARFGPDTATCEVFTKREGVLAAVGHDLKLRPERFEIEADATSVRARFDPSSLRVAAAIRAGREDPSAVSERDRRDIERSCAREVLEAHHFPEITFASTGIEGTILYSPSKKQDQAWEVAAFLGEPEQAKLFMYERGSGPILKSLLDDKILKENRFYKAALDSQPGWGSFPDWHPNWPKMGDRWGPEIQRLVKGEINAERFCKTMADILRKG